MSNEAVVNTSREERFRFITDAIPHMVWEVQPDGKVSYINKQWAEWTGLNLDQINQGSWDAFIHPDDYPKVVSGWQTAMVSGSQYLGEYRIRDQQGNYYWFLSHTVPVFDVYGNLIMWIGTCTNINNQKQIEEALKESEERFRQLADIMPQQVWTANQNGDLDYVNFVTTNYFNKSAETIIGRGWEDVVHPDDLEDVIRKWTHALQTREPYQVEFRLKASDGKYRWHLGRASSFTNNKGQVKWYGTNTDIEIHKSNEKKKDEFISMASHELKTPVTSLKGYTQILEHKFSQEGNTHAVELLKRMDLQVNKLTKLIEDFLSVSKIESRQFIIEKDEFDFKEFLNDVVITAQHTSAKHKIIIEQIDPVIYYGDKLRLEQVINNFIDNAIKYSPESDKILINSTIQSGNIIVSVQDFGIGIEKNNLHSIFDRFYRVDNTSMKFQGLGLGLFISSEIIKAHNGSFWIESEPGNGSTFFFLLPLNPQETVKDIDTDNQSYYYDKQVKIKFNVETKWLEVDWTGFQNLESVQRGCLVMLDLLKKNKVSKVLNDNSNVLGNWSEASDWGGKVWFPAMEQAGLKYFAWIYSASTFSKLAAHKSLDIMAGDITSQFFTGIDEAREWLLKMDKK